MTYDPEFQAGVRRSAQIVVPVLCVLFRPESVFDAGCGYGAWADAFCERGVKVTAVDLPDFDLRHPFTVEEDLALCLEVAEHIEEEHADSLVKSLCTAPVVVFSAATPDQPGEGHVNCQPHEYWHEKFSSHGMTMEDFRDSFNSPDVYPWYRNNLFAYSR